MTYDDAVALLHKPERWCDAAATLTRLGDVRAIKPLYGVIELVGEDLPDRSCVRDALDKLGARQQAAKLVASPQVAERRIAVGLMRELPADAHAPLLARIAAGDPDPDLRATAARALRTQKITPAWDAAMLSLLDAADADIRVLAASSLERRFGAPILAALRKRLAVETDREVRGALEAAIRLHVEHAATP